MLSTWLRFRWSLANLPAEFERSYAPFVVRLADKQEETTVEKVVASAYSMDSSWGDAIKQMEEYFKTGIARSFSLDPVQCIVLQHGSRIIGASAFIADASADNNLTTGPCILHEYRSRGLGGLLLQSSLMSLQSAGMSLAHGIARNHTTASRYLYPKFGGESEIWEAPVKVTPRLAA